MKHYLGIIFFAISVFYTRQATAQKTVILDTIVRQVTEVLDEIGKKADIPQPKKVSVTFETETSSESGGELKILIFKIGRRRTASQSSEIIFNFDLVPEKGIRPESSIKQALAKAIKDAYDKIAGLNNNKVKLSGFTIKVSLDVYKRQE